MYLYPLTILLHFGICCKIFWVWQKNKQYPSKKVAVSIFTGQGNSHQGVRLRCVRNILMQANFLNTHDTSGTRLLILVSNPARLVAKSINWAGGRSGCGAPLSHISSPDVSISHCQKMEARKKHSGLLPNFSNTLYSIRRSIEYLSSPRQKCFQLFPWPRDSEKTNSNCSNYLVCL